MAIFNSYVKLPEGIIHLWRYPLEIIHLNDVKYVYDPVIRRF